jgi:hypothetical protein
VRSFAFRRSTRALIGAGVLLIAAPAGSDVHTEVTDPAGDTVNEDNDSPIDVPEADILRSAIIVRADGIRLNVKVRQPTSPLTDRKWVGDESDTGIDWELETTGDDTADFVADYYTDSGKITGDVYRASDADKDEPPTLCQLKSAAFDPEIGYTAVVDPACVGNPDAVAYTATFFYDTDPSKPDGVVAEDSSPDSGMSARVGRS